jgi:beta-lactamase class A
LNIKFILKIVVMVVVFNLLPVHLTAQELGETLLQQVKDFKGDLGLYVRYLKTNETEEINADTLFPTASMIKVPILIKLFDCIDKGELAPDSLLTWHADSVNYPEDDGILCSMQNGRKISLSKVISLMITYSDNHASLWCQKMAGGGAEINKWLVDHGFLSTRVNSRTEGRLPNWQIYGWGQTTPREMARLLVMIREGLAVSPAASEEMYRTLTRIYWNDEALSRIPPYIQVASKQGAVDKSRSEVVLVNAPSGDYVFCVITKNQQDTSWQYSNEGYVILREVSGLLWKHFEPRSTWQQAPGSERYH